MEKVKAQPAADERSSSSASHGELRESERMLFFTDAVVAIAATLLVLPLMEEAAELASEETEEEMVGDEAEEEVSAVVERFYQQRGLQIVYFILSFFMIFLLWTKHIFIFAYVDKIVSKLLVLANGLWILTIIFIPLATILATKNSEDGWLFYFGVVETNLVVITAMIFIIRSNPESHMVQEHGPTTYCLVRQASLVGWGAIAMVIAALVNPEHGALAFLSLGLGSHFNDIILEHFFKIKMEQSPVDEVALFYTQSNFISLTMGLFIRKLGFRDNKFNFDHDDVHRDIFSRISERLIIFTDATVAISMTLLIVPLSDRTQTHKGSVAEFLSEQVWLLGALFYSFTIVYSNWKIHDSMYAHEDGRVHPTFFLFTLPWLMTIAYVPVATALLDANNLNESSSWRVAQFLLTLLLNRMVAAVLAFVVFNDGVKMPQNYLVPHVIAVLFGGLAVGLSFVVPFPWASLLLLLLFLNYPFSMVLLKLWPGLPALMTGKKNRNEEEKSFSC